MKHERPPGRHPRNLRGRRARPLVVVHGKTSYIQCRAQRVLASEDDHLEGAHAAPRDLAVHAERGGCPRCTERRLHHTTRRFRCWKRRQHRRSGAVTDAAARGRRTRPGPPSPGLVVDRCDAGRRPLRRCVRSRAFCKIMRKAPARSRRLTGGAVGAREVAGGSRRADSTLIVSACMPAIPRPVSPGVTGDPCGCAFSPRMRASCLDGPSNGPSTAERGGAPALVWVRFG